jgi:hypothetical protein
MKRIAQLFCIVIIFWYSAGAIAQDTIRHLVISEIRCDILNHTYVELTNMHETDSVYLGDFAWHSFGSPGPFFVKDREEVRLIPDQGLPYLPAYGWWLPDKMLGPGESHLIVNVQDVWNGAYRKHAIPVQSPELARRADEFIHWPDWSGGDHRFREYPVIPEIGCFGFDSTTIKGNHPVFMMGGLGAAFGLLWTHGDSIVVMVDQVLAEINWERGTVYGDQYNPVSTAGIKGAHGDYTLVRKFSIKEGETNWLLSRGSDAASSSWILIPHDKFWLSHMAFETEGNHGNFGLDYSSDVYTIDKAGGIIRVPWGTQKFDSIRTGLDLGPGMAWEYFQNLNKEDSLSMICKDNDTLVLYACGNELQVKKLTVKVDPPLDSDNSVYPKRGFIYPDPDFSTPGSVAIIGTDRMVWPVVDKYDGVLDTIGYVPFATPVDTLLMRLEKSPDAEWEIEYKWGQEGFEVEDGDLLKITAPDGSIKKYYIQVEDYFANDNVLLSSITWPDRPDDIYLDGWGKLGKSDTIPGFTPARSSYHIMLPAGTTIVPALDVRTADQNAKVEVDRATSLKGGSEERTTYFHITSDSDTTFSTVRVTFAVDNPDRQKYDGDPFFSKFYIRDWWSAGGVEICNPSDFDKDLSNYMIVRTEGTTLAEGLEMNWSKDSNTWLKRYRRYVPGYKWDNYNEWKIDPGFIEKDGLVDPFVGPKGIFVIWRLRNKPLRREEDFLKGLPVDVFMNYKFDDKPGVIENPWQEALTPHETVAYPVHVRDNTTNTGIYYLLKILNDSVLLGIKKANDVNDYRVVDVMGSTVTPWNISAGKMEHGECYLLRRKPHIYKGDTILGQHNHLTIADSSAWWCNQTYKDSVSDERYNRNNNKCLLGSHPLDPITYHHSVIYSVKYRVSGGYSRNETITGVSWGEDVATFLSNIIKADPVQHLEVLASDSTVKSMGALVTEGDILKVTGGTGCVTLYTISLAPIDGDPSLYAVDTSVKVSDSAPYQIGGFAFGTRIEWVLGKVAKAQESAVISVISRAGEQVPMKVRNSRDEYVDVIASSNHIFEVVAEDGTIRNYAIIPDTTPSEARILSDVYRVLETPVRILSEVPVGTGVHTFLKGIIPVKGASIKLLKLNGQERTIGQVGFGDRILVTSVDGAKTVDYTVCLEGFATAYVTSEIYTVDQDLMGILEVPPEIDVPDFLEGLTPSDRSSLSLQDEHGEQKSTGKVLESDVVHVVTEDETSEAYYFIDLGTAVNNNTAGQIMIYPNPAGDILHVKNIPLNTYVRITEITGRVMIVQKADKLNHGIDISDLAKGLYILSVETTGGKILTTKFIKK